jgi:hypothetical protein
MANRVELLDSILKAVVELQLSAPASGIAGVEEPLEEMLAEADNVLWSAIDYIADTHKFAAGDTSVVL